MGYVLLIFLIIELLLFYNFNGKNVVSPSFFGVAMFLLSTVIYLLADEYFGYEIHSVTVVVIIGLLACIFVGERFADALKISTNRINTSTPNTVNVIMTPIVVCILVAFVMLLVSILHAIEAYEYSLTVGNIDGNVANMAKYIREAKSNGFEALDLPIHINQGIVISECFVWFCVYSICNNRNCTGQFYFRYLWPIIAYIPNILVTDNRTTLIKMVAVCFIIIFIFTKQKYEWSKKGNVRIIMGGIMAIGLYLVIFRLLGYRTETSLRNELWDNFTEYMSASIVGLDKYLMNGEEPNILFGEGTLKGVYNIVRQWGISIPEVDQFEPFYTYANGESNAYTALKTYIHDYTMIGAVVAMFLWGTVINYSIKYIRKNGAGFIRMCFLGLMFYPVTMLSIADTTPSILSMTTVYTGFYLVIINAIFVKGKIRTSL